MGLGSLGAGIGIGELQGIMWLGFALTEAVVFYGLIGGFLGFVLVK
jgi:F0F1-type ATP synthase membrane subunit c/vacuolar-type H+-ATPase subunit K